MEKWSGGALRQINWGVETFVVSDDGTCEVAEPGSNGERIVRQVILRLTREEIHCEHEGLVLGAILGCCQDGGRRVLVDYCLLDRLHCLFLEHSDYFLEEESHNACDKDERSNDGAAVVVFWLLLTLQSWE